VGSLTSHNPVTGIATLSLLYCVAACRVSVYVLQSDWTQKALVRMLSPFSSGLWGTILATMALLLLAERATCTIALHCGFHEEADCQLLDSWLHVFGIFCQQGRLTGISSFRTRRTPWHESESELYRPSDSRLSAKLVPTFVGRGCHVVNVIDPNCRILGFLDRNRYFFFQLAAQLYSRG
jgi:hypothetical protein